MAAHFNWTQLIPGVGYEYVHVATAGVASLVMVGIGLVARKALGKGDRALEPADKISIRALFEMLTEMIGGVADMVIGHDGHKYVPIFAAIFFFVLFNNLFGLLPGMTPATDNINTTLALGLFSFIMYNIYGFREHGFVNYMKHFMGPVWWLAPFMFVLELISHFVRPFSLALRLMGNLQGDHTVLSIFLELVPIGVPIPFYVLGLFVCFMQAFVFTVLSMVYIAMATAHDH